MGFSRVLCLNEFWEWSLLRRSGFQLGIKQQYIIDEISTNAIVVKETQLAMTKPKVVGYDKY
jgi:hypothetical protein